MRNNETRKIRVKKATHSNNGDMRLSAYQVIKHAVHEIITG
jgi:hypothetical protein